MNEWAMLHRRPGWRHGSGQLPYRALGKVFEDSCCLAEAFQLFRCTAVLHRLLPVMSPP